MEKIYLTKNLSDYSLFNYKDKSLIIKKTYPEEFIQIPTNINLKSDQNSIKLFSKLKLKNEFMNFISILNSFLFKDKKEVFVKRIKIKGLGYKISKEEDNLILNLGYSKPIKTKIPTQISNIIVKKTIVVVESLDKVFLGNFASLLFSLKKRDIYKGKGLSLEYSNSKLKAIKKK
jgi:large subunit ribosomal protein L6